VSNSDYGERISKLEEKTDNIEKKVDDLSDIKTVVTELALLSRQQVEQNKEFKETQTMLVLSNTKFNTILETMNENLTKMNSEIKETNKKMSDLETKVGSMDNSEKIIDLETKVGDLDDKSKVDILKIAIKAVPWFLGAGITYGIYKIVIEVMKL
jgi:uncharacterized coiled-coil protein SlyX